MSNFTMTPEEDQALQQIAATVAEESAVVMSTLLDKKIELKLQSSGAAAADALGGVFPGEMVVVDCPFASGFDATNSFVFNKPLVAKLSDLMMMGDGTAEFNEDHIDAIQEGVNQMMGAAAATLSTKLNKSVDFQPSSARLSVFAEAGLAIDDLTAVNFDLEIEGTSQGAIALLIPYTVIQESAAAMSSGAAKEAAEEGAGAGDMDMGLAGLDVGAGQAGEEEGEEEAAGGGFGGGGGFAMPQIAGISSKERERLELLMDIRLDVSIELGRSIMLVRDILELGPGSVIELNKMAGESVDLLINNKKLAEGEVVVVDENFGVRITHLVSMEERIRMLQTA